MYSDAELDAAVSAGVLTSEAAASFRAFALSRRSISAVDEEHFRLLTGFNDIFVSIATLLILIAVDWLGRQSSQALGALLTASVSWGLAEYFTRRRRMALPSILLLFGFIGGAFFLGFHLISADWSPLRLSSAPLKFGIAAAVAALAATAHWRRFMVPITLAAGTVAAVGTIIGLLLGLIPDMRNFVSPLVFLGGLVAFAVAMHWDMSDRERMTRRSDVAFWLHLFAAPLIVHPAFALLGVSGLGVFSGPMAGQIGVVNAALAVAIYVGLAMVALAIDRRALLVSALFYVLYAISALFRAAGSLTSSLALTALIIGSGLLLLSAFWHRSRQVVVGWLPAMIRARLPVVS